MGRDPTFPQILASSVTPISFPPHFHSPYYDYELKHNEYRLMNSIVEHLSWRGLLMILRQARCKGKAHLVKQGEPAWHE
jgi:hypothetical protein